MRRIPDFLKRHFLLLGFVTALVPVLVLLGLQYTWLARLQTVSEAARQTALQNYLQGVGSEVEYYYRASAERLLNLPASIFLPAGPPRSPVFVQPRGVEGARRLFVVDFSHNRKGEVRLFDPSGKPDSGASSLGEAVAIGMASSPWTLEAGGIPRTSGLCVDERDPRYRMILNPISDDSSRVVGLAGMILDEDYFLHELLVRATKRALPKYFSDGNRRDLNDLVVRVHDAHGTLMMASSKVESPGTPETRNFPFIFTDWTVSLHTGQASPQKWAQITQQSNMALALLVSLLLLGGVMVALRSAERAVHLSEMKSDFVSNVSHELRTPVASIRMFAEFLRLGRARTPEKIREYGEHIEAESRRLALLIDSILDFSRIESGRRTYRLAPTDLVGLVRETVDLFEVRLADSGFRLTLDLPATPPPPIELDREALGQALQNLIENAIKYSGPGREIAVRVATPPGEVTVAVRDRGIGIPRAEQKKIFERFHRVGSSLVHDVKGSGLGLAIVHHIVEAHRGRVTVDSTPDQGSTFTIHLPASAPGLQSVAAPAAGRRLEPGQATTPGAG